MLPLPMIWLSWHEAHVMVNELPVVLARYGHVAEVWLDAITPSTLDNGVQVTVRVVEVVVLMPHAISV